MDWLPTPLPRLGELREQLLLRTLEHAARSVPYYRRTLGRAWRTVRTAADLPRLPLLTKDAAIAHQGALVSGTPPAFAGVLSSGTHHREGRVLRVPRSPEEDARTRELAHALGADAPDGDEGAGWVLEVRAAHHGALLAPPGPGRLRLDWTFDAASPRAVQAALARGGPDGRPVTALVIGAGALMPLTAWLWERGVEPWRYGVRLIGTTSFRLSPHWKALLEEAWGARVLDNYSLSELPTPALECEDCGFHHWLLPPLVSEVLDPFTRAPARGDTGVLVLTSLWPFVQVMPLVRYWTGDLVRLGPACPRTGERGLRCLGRLAQAAVHRRFGVLVAPQDVSDALEARPDVARHPHPLQTLGVVACPDTGAAKFELQPERGRRRLRLRVEARFEPALFDAQAAALAAQVGAALRGASAGLRAWERSGAGGLAVEVVRPGTLKAGWVKF